VVDKRVLCLHMVRSSDTVIAEVYRLLREEDHAPGDLLGSESELAARLHVGRAVMREALRMLEREGAVVVRPGVGGGVFLALDDTRPLAGALRVMRAREGWEAGSVRQAYVEIMAYLARKAAEEADDAELETLSRFNRAWVESFDRGEEEEAAREARRGFDQKLLEAAHSPVLAAIARALEEILREEVSGGGPSGEEGAGRVAYSHGYILEALRRRTPREAAERMRRHLTAGGMEVGGADGNG